MMMATTVQLWWGYAFEFHHIKYLDHDFDRYIISVHSKKELSVIGVVASSKNKNLEKKILRNNESGNRKLQELQNQVKLEITLERNRSYEFSFSLIFFSPKK